jgi:Uma2 family endonuclease
MQWSEVIANPYLRNLPFKIELNGFGQVLMSPASNTHGMVQSDIGYLFRSKLPKGRVITECSILTRDGVRVADVAWASDEFVARHGEVTPFPQSPELCVEIVSPSNTRAEIDYKVSLYFAQGAQEVWVVNLKREVKIYVGGLQSAKSKYLPRFKELPR